MLWRGSSTLNVATLQPDIQSWKCCNESILLSFHTIAYVGWVQDMFVDASLENKCKGNLLCMLYIVQYTPALFDRSGCVLAGNILKRLYNQTTLIVMIYCTQYGALRNPLKVNFTLQKWHENWMANTKPLSMTRFVFSTLFYYKHNYSTSKRLLETIYLEYHLCQCVNIRHKVQWVAHGWEKYHWH